MTLLAAAIFSLSLVGIIALFVLKQQELKRGAVFFPDARLQADKRAMRLKELALAARSDLSKVPPLMVRTGRTLVHDAALTSAGIARAAERGAYRIADLVSHKRHFERRETRSEFLKKVAEHKSSGLDTASEDGHNT